MVCVGDELRPRMISRGTRFRSGEAGWCQLGGSVTDFTEEREREKTFSKGSVKRRKNEEIERGAKLKREKG